ncbi:hypothetical protein C1645_837422 [Glomus cerebriforme]|uniref:SET domain-containing protein n=1 Tax=Glomus cerebriforme TaxID=658196 RepID=A0A397S591_9GLOM|nr:hypothetical protein C1645_837422 [Glomus cerebriforme]
MQNAILRLNTSIISHKKSRKELIDEHKRLEFFGDESHKFVIHNTCQDKSSLNLQLRISIADLKVDNVPINRFLICRVITRFIKLDALFTLVEDPEGNVERLVLNNWTEIPKKDQSDCFYIDQLFLPVGTQLVIKNLSYNVAVDGNTIIHSNNPKDVIVIYHHDKKLFGDLKWSTVLNEKEVKRKTVDDFRHYGNNYFALNNFKAAINEYSNGIKLDPKNVTLLSNRAEAYLRLDQFFNALNDVENALKYEPSHLKAAYRKCKALCGLKRYQEAIITVRDLYQRLKINMNPSIIPMKQSTERLLMHVELLISENEKGQYDFTSIIDEFCEKSKIKIDSKGNDVWVNNVGPRLDHADYLINDIEISTIKGKGRGWIAKCDIPENTLLMVSKALKIVYNHEVSGHIMTHDNISNNKTVFIGSTEELITSITQKLLEEPYLCQEVYQLYDGLNLDKTDIINNRVVSVEVIGNTVNYNSFAFDSRIKNNYLNGSGIWILPSYFNHSCVDYNVSLYFLGDLLIVRSLQPISKGEELIINYITDSNYELRANHLESVEINCQCRICKLDRSESKEIKIRRAQLLSTFEKSIKPRISDNINPSIIKGLEEIIAGLRNLRKDHLDLEFDTFEFCRILSFAYRYNGNKKRALSIQEEVYDLHKTGYFPVKCCVMFDIAILNANLEQMKEAMKWFDAAVKTLVEPIIGDIKDDDVKLKKVALNLAEKISPDLIFIAKSLLGLK